MHRTEGANNSGGLFVDGPPPTVITKEWCNSVQEEIVNVIEAANLSLNQASNDTNDQLLTALLRFVLPVDGWTVFPYTMTFASDDDPTYTVTVEYDARTFIAPGMRIKLTDSSTQYFIVTAISYSDPTTTITLYGGSQGDLSGGTITAPYFSRDKAPVGFSLDPDDWTERFLSSANDLVSSPSLGAYRNIDTVSTHKLSIPIGLWKVSYSLDVKFIYSTGSDFVTIASTLSTSATTESDPNFTSVHAIEVDAASNIIENLYSHLDREKILSLSSKTDYYLNLFYSADGLTQLGTLGSSYGPSEIKAVCSYL